MNYADAINTALGHASKAAIPATTPVHEAQPMAAPKREPRPLPASPVRHVSGQIIRPLSEFEVNRFRFCMEQFRLGKLNWDGYYSILIEPGVAMFGEPINDSPWVFVDSEEPVIVVFTPEPGSGTDALRKRIQAQQFFNSLT